MAEALFFGHGDCVHLERWYRLKSRRIAARDCSFSFILSTKQKDFTSILLCREARQNLKPPASQDKEKPVNNLSIGQKIVTLNIALGSRLSYEFQDYCGSHNPNHHPSKPAFCELKCVDPEKNEFVMTRAWNPDLGDDIVELTNGPKVTPIGNELSAPFSTLQYYDAHNHHLFNIRRHWLRADHYLQHLTGIVDNAVVNEDPYLYSKERFFRIIRELKLLFEQGESIPHAFLERPSLSIPRSRFEQFCIEFWPMVRHCNFDESKGPRWGQAFYDYMQAHKVVQDAWWWDRLYNAKDRHAIAMVRSMLDYNS